MGIGSGCPIITSLGSLKATDMMVALLALGIHEVQARLLRENPLYEARD